MGDIENIQADILASATAEVKHAFMIWDVPPAQAIAKAVLNAASKIARENVLNLVQPDDKPEDAYNIVCKILEQNYRI